MTWILLIAALLVASPGEEPSMFDEPYNWPRLVACLVLVVLAVAVHIAHMRAVTVRPPWSWAIARGLKTVENRTRSQSWRGPLLIHAGASWSVRGATDIRIREAWWSATGGAPDSDRLPQVPDPQRISGTLVHPSVRTGPPAAAIELGAIVASCELVDCHPAHGCCEPWGEASYVEAGGRRRTDIWHLVLDEIRPIEPAVPAIGRLGLWKPPADVVRLLPDRAR